MVIVGFLVNVHPIISNTIEMANELRRMIQKEMKSEKTVELALVNKPTRFGRTDRVETIALHIFVDEKEAYGIREVLARLQEKGTMVIDVC